MKKNNNIINRSSSNSDHCYRNTNNLKYNNNNNNKLDQSQQQFVKHLSLSPFNQDTSLNYSFPTISGQNNQTIHIGDPDHNIEMIQELNELQQSQSNEQNNKYTTSILIHPNNQQQQKKQSKQNQQTQQPMTGSSSCSSNTSSSETNNDQYDQQQQEQFQQIENFRQYNNKFSNGSKNSVTLQSPQLAAITQSQRMGPKSQQRKRSSCLPELGVKEFEKKDLVIKMFFQQFKNNQNGGSNIDLAFQPENNHGENDGKQPQIMQKDKKLIWKESCFKIIYFVNHFVFKLKKSTINKIPKNLNKNQLQAIDDKASRDFNIRKALKKKNFYRSQYKTVRRLILFKKILVKKFRVLTQPIKNFYTWLSKSIHHLLKPIPVLYPFEKIRLIWDFILVFILTIQFIILPIEMCYQTYDIDLSLYNYLFTSIYIIDSLFYLNTGFYEKGEIVIDRKQILNRYIRKELFKQVLCIYLVLTYRPFSNLGLKTLFIWRIKDIYEILKKLKDTFQLDQTISILLVLLTLILELILCCHWFACAWNFLGYYDLKNQSHQNWITVYQIQELTFYQSYIKSLYFAIITITTIGYGDISPTNEIEMIFIGFMAIASSGVFAYIINEVSNIMLDIQKKEEDYKIKLSEMNLFMHQRNVNQNLQTKARNYLKYAYKEGIHQKMTVDTTLNQISRYIKEEIVTEVYLKTLTKVPFLENFSNPFLAALSLKMKEETYGPDETILAENEDEDENKRFFIVQKGEVNVITPSTFNYHDQKKDPKVFETLTKGKVFGVYNLFSSQQCPNYPVLSQGVSQLQYLYFEDFLDTIRDFSDDFEQYNLLREKLNFNFDYQSIYLKCWSCKSASHLIDNCPFIFPQINKLKVIKMHIRNEPQKDRIPNIKRRKKIKKNGLISHEQIYNRCKNFQYEEYDLIDDYAYDIGIESQESELSEYLSKEANDFRQDSQYGQKTNNNIMQYSDISNPLIKSQPMSNNNLNYNTNNNNNNCCNSNNSIVQISNVNNTTSLFNSNINSNSNQQTYLQQLQQQQQQQQQQPSSYQPVNNNQYRQSRTRHYSASRQQEAIEDIPRGQAISRIKTDNINPAAINNLAAIENITTFTSSNINNNNNAPLSNPKNNFHRKNSVFQQQQISNIYQTRQMHESLQKQPNRQRDNSIRNQNNFQNNQIQILVNLLQDMHSKQQEQEQERLETRRMSINPWQNHQMMNDQFNKIKTLNEMDSIKNFKIYFPYYNHEIIIEYHNQYNQAKQKFEYKQQMSMASAKAIRQRKHKIATILNGVFKSQ